MSTYANAAEIREVPDIDDMEVDMATQDALNPLADRLHRQTTASRVEYDPDTMNIDIDSRMQPQSSESQNLPWVGYLEPWHGRQQNDAFQPWNTSSDNAGWPGTALHNPPANMNMCGGYGRTMCGACREMISTDNLLTIGCGCHYCKSCFNGYFETGLANRASFPPRCCGQEIYLPSVRQYLENRVVQRYEDVQEEFGSKNPTYCAGCGTFLSGAFVSGDFKSCLKCPQQTCIRCKNLRSLHGMSDEIGRTNLATTGYSRGRQCPEADVPPEITALIKKEEWNRCPRCQHVVEKIDGCNFMECRCGAEFCYGCGAEYGTDDEYCKCPDNLGDAEEDEDVEDTEEEVEEDESGEWPQYSAAVNPRGRIRCMHELTSLLDEDGEGGDNSGRCHGCLREMPEIRSCNTCRLELCAECLR